MTERERGRVDSETTRRSAVEATGDGRGGVLLCTPVADEVARLAGTQYETAVPSDSELIVHLPRLEDVVAAALELARWVRSMPARAGPARVLVVEARGREPVLSGLTRGRALLGRAPAGLPCLESAAGERVDLDWIAVEAGDGVSVIRWTGPGERPPEADASRWAPQPQRPMIGRREELAELARRWSAACEGTPQLALLAGEPGAGKTRLAAEACGEIRRAGGQVLYGAASDAEAGPYAPFVTALAGPRAREGHPEPDFAELVLGADAGAAGPASAALGAERSAAFNAAVGELEHRCRSGPAALVIEDLHNCGLSSLQLLNHLAGSPDLKRLLIVATYRPTDVEPDSEEAASIARLRSRAGSAHIDLGPLEMRSLRGLAASFGIERSRLEEAAKLAFEQAGGLPLYCCELMRMLAGGESDPSVPRSLQLLISSRVHASGPDVHDHLSAAAAAGTSFHPRIVAAAAGFAAEELAESLRRARQARLVAPGPSSGEYSFEHALTRHSLYDELSPTRRGELHRRIAIAMEEADGAGESVEPSRIARQWELADPGDPDRAAHWAERAADDALARFDPGAAVGWYERALEITGGDGAGEPERRCDLLLGLGAALRLAGSARFRDVLLAAARLAVELDDDTRLAAATLTNTRGFVSAIGGFDRERLAMLELAAGRVEDRRLLSLVLAELAIELTFSPERERRHELAVRSLELARGLDEGPLLARVLIRNVIARWEPGNARARIKLAEECVRIGATLDDPLDLFHGLHWRAAAEIEACEIDAAHRSINEEARIAARLGDPTAEWLAECSQSLRHAIRGRLAEAEVTAERAAELGRASDQPDALPFYASQIASIRWQQGRLAELAPLLDAALEQHPGLPAFRSLVALARLAAGNAEGGREVIAIDSADRFARLPRDPTWFAGAVTYAHVAAELEDADAAGSLLELLDPLLGRLATTSVSLWGLTDHAVGRLAATLGDNGRAVTLLDRSLNEYTRFSMPIWRGQAAVDLATVLRSSGSNGTRADELTGLAATIGRSHGAGLLADDGLGRPHDGLEVIPEARLAELDLTSRQREIIALIARGMTNSEIAELLAISPSTVKRHAENASERTGVRGRKGLLGLLYERGGEGNALSAEEPEERSPDRR